MCTDGIIFDFLWATTCNFCPNFTKHFDGCTKKMSNLVITEHRRVKGFILNKRTSFLLACEWFINNGIDGCTGVRKHKRILIRKIAITFTDHVFATGCKIFKGKFPISFITSLSIGFGTLTYNELTSYPVLNRETLPLTINVQRKTGLSDVWNVIHKEEKAMLEHTITHHTRKTTYLNLSLFTCIFAAERAKRVSSNIIRI